jgi:DNA-binding transcriptional MocR family regulator
MSHDAAAATPKGCPKYLKLAKSFERQLRSGVLRVGDRLPSVRQLRAHHRVSAATAVGCYLWLERQGYVRARPKSGFFVSRTPQAEGPAPDISPRLRRPVRVNMGGLRSDAGPLADRAGVIDLGPAVVGPGLLPMARLNRSIRLALSAFGDNAVKYEDPRGNLRLRRQIAKLVFRQGANASPDDIIVTSGSTEAINLSIRAVARPGDIIAVETPGCYEVLQVLEALHMRAYEIPHVPGRGPDLDILADAVDRHRVKAALLTVTCQNPLGECLSDDRKADLIDLATRKQLPIIEGDVFGDLLFSGERPRPLKAFDRDGLVLQCSSLAHYVAPGFNLGWSNAGRFQPEVERLKTITNLAASRLPQLALAEFLESGAFDKHVKQLRVALWQSVDASREEVLRTFPHGTRVSRPQGGFVLWIQLPDQFDGVDLYRKAAAAGINILPGLVFSPSCKYKSYVRIACGHPIEVMTPAIRKLAALMLPRS